MLGFLLPAWTKTIKRKPISTAKFYLFDTGVRNELAGIRNLEPHSDLYGQAFEHFIAMELRAYISYTRKHLELSYWRSKHGHEVDFIIGDEIAIEIKTTKKVTKKHLKGLHFLLEEDICTRYYLVSFDRFEIIKDGIHQLHWETFLHKLWAEEIVSE